MCAYIQCVRVLSALMLIRRNIVAKLDQSIYIYMCVPHQCVFDFVEEEEETLSE